VIRKIGPDARVAPHVARTALFSLQDGASGGRQGPLPAGPKAWREAEKIRDRFLHEVAEKRNPRTSATVDQLLTRYLDQFDGAPNTLTLYRAYVRNHVLPFLGHLKVGELDADVLDSFYAELRRCRDHCSGRRTIQHRVKGPHECDDRCGSHACRPVGRPERRSPPMTTTTSSAVPGRSFVRAAIWLPGLAVAVGAAVATAHGLYEVAG
jgi:hypothetical protein